MKKIILFGNLFFSTIIINAQQNDFPKLTGLYLGQKPPGVTPELFAEGIVSTGKNEVNAVFSKDGKEFYYSLFNSGKGYTIMMMEEKKDGWTKPTVAPFSGKYSEVDMFITPDGNQFYYVSKRPFKEGESRSPGYQIWFMNRTSKGWGEPKNLGPIINSGKRQLYPSVTNNGTIYFGSNRNGKSDSDIYRSYLKNGIYTIPEKLGDSINTDYDETDVYVSPDESYIIFTAVNKLDGLGSGDNYISFRKKDGSWTKAKNLGSPLNSPYSDFCPMLSPDGKYFFFTSGRRGNDDIYWVSSEFTKKLRPKN